MAKKNNKVDRPRPRDHRPPGVMQRVLESLFDLEMVLGAIYAVAGYALWELRAMMCVGSSRLGMLDCKTVSEPKDSPM